MKSRYLAIASIVALSVALAGAAHAESIVAGWDFSQFQVDGIRTIDGTTTTTSLPANYSSFDTSFNAGSDAATYGTATLGTGIIPTHGSLESNIDGTVLGPGDVSMDARTVLKEEGQIFTELMSLTLSGGADSVVFMADLSGETESDTGWKATFGGTSLGGDSEVTVEFSTDGSSYTTIDTVTLDETDQEFPFDLGARVGDEAYVRLTLDPSLGGQPVIDNMTIALPEPGSTLGLMMGFTTLLGLARRRA